MSDLTMATLRPVVIEAGQEISRLLGYEKSSQRSLAASESAASNGVSG